MLTQARTTTLAASSLAVRIGGLAPSVVMAQLAQLLTGNGHGDGNGDGDGDGDGVWPTILVDWGPMW